MTPAEIAQLTSAIRDITISAALILILVAGSRRVWVWGWHLDALNKIIEDLRAENAQWKTLVASYQTVANETISRLSLAVDNRAAIEALRKEVENDRRLHQQQRPK